MAMTKKYTLSKSRVIRGLQCHKSLWLYTHIPELRLESDEAKIIFAQGNDIGELAQDLYPNGYLIPFDNVSIDDQLKMTQKALATQNVIYEAAFSYNGVFIKADILRKTSRGWYLYEVKSSSEVKDVYLDDVAVQYHVITGSGVNITKAFVVHINTAYVRLGDLNLQELFVENNVTREILDRQDAIIKEIGKQQKMLTRKTSPKIDIGSHCGAPYECDFKHHCWKHIPDNSVFDLKGRGVDKFALYRAGFLKMKDLPLDHLKGQQLQQAQVARSKTVVVEKNGLKKFLSQLSYPLYFLDFETFMSAVPQFDNQRPYQQIPFQYSLHWFKKPGGKLHHTEYLAQPGVDPRKELVAQLLKDIPENACVLAYWKSFEVSRIKEQAELFPSKKKRLLAIADKMIDLIGPFKSRCIYSWKQNGSHSIKDVLPAFVQGMSYEGMEIANGGAAMEAYHQMCAMADKPAELAKIRTALLQYCEQDTLAMVKLLEVIKQMA